MRTIKTKVYQFSELSKDAQQKAIEWFLNCNNDSFAWEQITEDAKEIGLKIISFRDRYPSEGEFMLAANEVAQNIFNNHGEVCDTYKTAESFMNEWQPVFSEYLNENSDKYESSDSEQILLKLESDFLNDLLEDYRKMYNDQVQYEYSDEYAKDTIEANEFEFTEDGKPI